MPVLRLFFCAHGLVPPFIWVQICCKYGVLLGLRSVSFFGVLILVFVGFCHAGARMASARAENFDTALKHKKEGISGEDHT